MCDASIIEEALRNAIQRRSRVMTPPLARRALYIDFEGLAPRQDGQEFPPSLLGVMRAGSFEAHILDEQLKLLVNPRRGFERMPRCFLELDESI
jgi:hypothetical protein